MDNTPVTGIPGARLWLMSLRPFSFTASIMPMLLALVLSLESGVIWWVYVCYFSSGLLLHAGTNVLNDYYDFENGVDLEGDIDPSHLLPQKLVSPRFMKVTGHLYFGVGILVGSLIGIERGGLFVTLGITGAVLAYFYTGARISLKYVALGDVLVFFLLGPAMVAMGVWALQGTPGWEEVLISGPMAFLVASILHSNNLRDIHSDREAGVQTLAGLFGLTYSRHFLSILLLVPFAYTGSLIVAGLLPFVSLVTLIALLPAIKVMRTVYATSEPHDLSDLTMRAAALHLIFSLLFVGTLLLWQTTGIG